MIGYLLFLQVFAVMVQARPNHFDEMNNLMENDANLNPGFDIDAFRLDQLNLHNYYRSLHGVPPMTRDADLEAKAQEYAETLAANNNGLNHCNLPTCDRESAGENLAAASGSTSAETNATKAWYKEVWDYNYCHDESNFKRPGHESKAIGHFTQVIWKASTKLGIGYARTSDKTKVYVVGRYKDPGNVGNQYEENVPKAQYLFNTFQDNCNGVNGAFTAWSEPGECSRSCGGGIRFKTRTCTNPKPSLNGADCGGATRQLAAAEWCNIESCSGDKTHRDQQCEARGRPTPAYTNQNCKLYCYNGPGNPYNGAGTVDDGTHCNSDSGVCVDGVCTTMPQYVAPTQPPPTNAAGSITGSYTAIPSSKVYASKIFSVPNGATNFVVTNNDYNAVSMSVGYSKTGFNGIDFSEGSWLDLLIQYYGSYETTRTVVGVTYVYKRTDSSSTITIAGPVNPTSGYSFDLLVKGGSPADISWTYNPKIVLS